MLVSSHANNRPHMLTYSTFKLTLSCLFHLLLFTPCIMRVHDALYHVHSLLKRSGSVYKHESIQVVVPASVTIHKTGIQTFGHV